MNPIEEKSAICIWRLKNAINGSMFDEYRKSQNTQVVHTNLHILGSIFLLFIELKLPVSVSTFLHILHEENKDVIPVS
jgi:hypothetical protein